MPLRITLPFLFAVVSKTKQVMGLALLLLLDTVVLVLLG